MLHPLQQLRLDEWVGLRLRHLFAEADALHLKLFRQRSEGVNLRKVEGTEILNSVLFHPVDADRLQGVVQRAGLLVQLAAGCLLWAFARLDMAAGDLKALPLAVLAVNPFFFMAANDDSKPQLPGKLFRSLRDETNLHDDKTFFPFGCA